jgi:hypothetical protein
MKKTPAEFAATPAYNALQALVAVAALSGLASNMTAKAQATEQEGFKYNAETQKGQLGALTNLYTNTNGNQQTSSKTFQGQIFPSNDDNNSFTDSDN